MKIITRYANRKHYDTEASKYVNLGQIYAFTISETPFKVVCNKTKNDITRSVILNAYYNNPNADWHRYANKFAPGAGV